MDFAEADQKRTRLSGQRARGQITQDQFTAGINALRVTDSTGRIWQPAPSPAGWLCWNGTAWQKATPPGQMSPQAGKSAKDFGEFKSSLMTVDEFRKVSKDVPLAKRPQRWWDLLSILGGIVGAVIWFLYGGIRSGSEGLDLVTPILMIGIPIVLVWLRSDIDQLLLPIQPYRKKISKIILIGLGIAIPFLTAWILYNIFHISQYPLMQANIVVGTFAAYIITRDPQPSGAAGGKGMPGAAMIVFSLALCSCIIAPVIAHDCAQDPLNAQDCLRTDGYAEVMAGLISTILGILVNGPIILQGLLQGAAGAAGAVPGAQPPAPSGGPYIGDKREYTDHRGVAHEATLQADGHWLTDEGTWIDFDNLEAAKKQYQDDQAWIADQREKEAARFKADMEDYARKLEEIKNYKDPEKAAFDKWYRDYLEKSQRTKEFQQAMYNSQANIMSRLTSAAEWTEKGADMSIDVLSKMTGPQGKAFKRAYVSIKDIAKNISASHAKGEELTKGLIKGVEEAVFDAAFDAAKEKFTKATGGRIPGFRDFKGGNFPDLSDNVISDALNREMARTMFEAQIRDAARDSMNNMVQSQFQKMLIKDPLKTALGLK